MSRSTKSRSLRECSPWRTDALAAAAWLRDDRWASPTGDPSPLTQRTVDARSRLAAYRGQRELDEHTTPALSATGSGAFTLWPALSATGSGALTLWPVLSAMGEWRYALARAVRHARAALRPGACCPPWGSGATPW